jgi:hypothetical protein
MEVMKNIHVLPTEKPSRFHTWINDKGLRVTLYEQPQLDIKSAKNIYITSDEKIKEGDWCYDLDTKYVKIKQSWENSHLDFNCKKIILTTDQDLIKDGVQAIDDEFLEWFVKNPSCEEVEVADLWREGNPSTHDSYQLVIPQEEPKEEQTKCYCGHTITCDCGPLEEPKQYPIGGYAPGNYTCTCVSCKTMFRGDKRAVQCEPCAIKMTQEEPKQEGYICPQTKLQCRDECCVSAEDCHIEAGFGIISDCEPPKQETLENLKNQLKKVIKEHPICVNEDTYWRGVKIGLETAIEVVKLQKQDKKMYSEEEVNNMFATLKINSVNNVATITNVDLFISSWKKQFKNK